jgi:hypothetical protein
MAFPRSRILQAVSRAWYDVAFLAGPEQRDGERDYHGKELPKKLTRLSLFRWKILLTLPAQHRGCVGKLQRAKIRSTKRKLCNLVQVSDSKRS